MSISTNYIPGKCIDLLRKAKSEGGAEFSMRKFSEDAWLIEFTVQGVMKSGVFDLAESETEEVQNFINRANRK